MNRKMVVPLTNVKQPKTIANTYASIHQLDIIVIATKGKFMTIQTNTTNITKTKLFAHLLLLLVLFFHCRGRCSRYRLFFFCFVQQKH